MYSKNNDFDSKWISWSNDHGRIYIVDDHGRKMYSMNNNYDSKYI